MKARFIGGALMACILAGSASPSERMFGDLSSDGTCLSIIGKQNLLIENTKIGPCRGPGISILGSRNISIRNVTIDGAEGVGVYIYKSEDVSVMDSFLRGGKSGVYAEQSKNIQIGHSRFLNVQGPMPRGQFVQFNRVTGSSRIFCNKGINEMGRSVPEDAISIFKSRGTRQVPIVVDHNVVVGGGPSTSGGGIMLGDGGGEWLIAKNNTLIDPGQYGIGVAGGSHILIEQNSVFARRQEFTNVGIYVWNQSKSACSDIVVRNNMVSWTNNMNRQNPWWNGKNCDDVNIEPSNQWNSPLTQKDAEFFPAYCATAPHAGLSKCEGNDALCFGMENPPD